MMPVLKTVGTTLDLTSRDVRNVAVKGRLNLASRSRRPRKTSR